MIFYIDNIFFFLCVLFILISTLGIILVNNPVHSVLLLVLVFCNSIFIFFSLKAEFIAIVLLIIYVGAILVLFLFVIMMLNIRKLEMNKLVFQYLPIIFLISLCLFFELYFNLFDLIVFTNDLTFFNFYDLVFQNFLTYTNFTKIINFSWNLEILTNILFYYNFLIFLLASLILLLAMLGSIVLTLNVQLKNKKQEILLQIIKQLKIIIKK